MDSSQDVVLLEANAMRARPTRPSILKRQALRVALVALGALAVALSATRRLDHSLSWDEPTTANRVQLQVSALLEDCRANNASPLYYLLLKPWAALFGESELALRGFSMLCLGSAVVVLGLAVAGAGGFRVGLLAAMLLASSDLAAFQGANARPYALLLLLSSVSTGLAILLADTSDTRESRLVPEPSRAFWPFVTCLALAQALGLLVHPLFIITVGATTLVGVVVLRGRSQRAVVIAAVIAVVVWQALWPTGWSGSAPRAIDWIPPPSWQGIVEAGGFMWGRSRGLLLAGWLVVLLVSGVLTGRARHRPAAGRRQVAWFASAACLFALTAPLAISLVKPVFHANRTLVFGLPMLCVTLAFFMARSPLVPVTWVVMAALLGGSGLRYIRAGAADAIPTRTSLERVAAEAACGDVFVLGHISRQEVTYYLRQLGFAQCVELVSFPAETSRHPGWFDDRGVAERADDVAREAETLAAAVDARAKTVWLFEGGSDVARWATSQFRESLDRRRRGVRLPGLRGSHFDFGSRYPSSTTDD